MRYEIICDQPNRLRLRFGKYVFTKEQCYGISDMLLSLTGVTFVKVNCRNGSVLIEYDRKDVKEVILTHFSSLSLKDIKKVSPSDEDKAEVLETDIRKKIATHCIKHLLRTLFMPKILKGLYTVYRALPFLNHGLKSLLHKKLNVEVLDATAIGASLIYRNFSTASSTMFLLGLSDLLLEYSNMRARNALAHSLAINVDSVWLVSNGVEVESSLNDLKKNDIIRVRKGSLIPVDGTIVSGDASINESSMTGEPIPVSKSVDQTVFAGTVIEDGEIDVQVLNLKNESRIAKIINLIDTGEKDKSLVQGRAERLADGIVPVSFGLFAATLLLTRSMPRALSVLMVDFSCAIKLTTPITVISALKESVNHQFLVKGGKYLEILSKVDTVVFDKTGTLTNAVPKVSKVIVMKQGYSVDKVLRIAACLEEHFPHSVASSIVSAAKKKNLLHPEEHGKVEYIVAHGIASTYKDAHSIIGSKHFVFEDEGVPYPYDKEEYLLREIGSDTAVYLAVDQELIGIICVNDPPRDDAKETINLLRKEGISEILMITGDSEGSAKYTSELLGLDHYYSSVLPDEKAKIIEQLKAAGKTVLMVGDGINDAPALACADVSLTLNGSSDIAREVADISVLSDDLTKIVLARKLATGLMKKIYNQYGFIVSFNTLLIILGLGGLIRAEQSAWLHNTSTLSLTALAAKPILAKETNAQKEDTTYETA